MRSRFLKPLALVLTVVMLMTCMTGCDTLDYREAVQLYNARQYEQAAEIFAALGEYEDSAALFRASRYWDAYDRMQAGSYGEALPRFLKLGDYEDAAQRATECKYQLAIEAFEAADYATAQNHFDELADYRLTQEYLRQLNWQKLYDHIATVGEESGGSFVICREADDRTVNFMVDMSTPDTILMVTTWTKDMGYVFQEELQLSLKRDTTTADFTATSTFTMDFHDGQIGTQQIGTGTVALDIYEAGTELILDEFSLSGTDNLGNTQSSQDSADSTMGEAMVTNLSAILDTLPLVLEEAGIEPIF